MEFLNGASSTKKRKYQQRRRIAESTTVSPSGIKKLSEIFFFQYWENTDTFILHSIQKNLPRKWNMLLLLFALRVCLPRAVHDSFFDFSALDSLFSLHIKRLIHIYKKWDANHIFSCNKREDTLMLQSNVLSYTILSSTIKFRLPHRSACALKRHICSRKKLPRTRSSW